MFAMRRRLVSLALFLWMGVRAVAAEGLPPAELDQLMASTLQRLRFNVALMEAEYERIVTDSSALSNCDSLALAAYLWHNIDERRSDWSKPFPLDTNLCPVSNHSLHYTFGAHAYRQGRIEDMEGHIRLALRTASTPYFEFISWQAMGLVHQMKNQPDSAYSAFVQSYETMPEAMDAQGLNNLANAALIGEHWEAAVEWAVLAEERYYEFLRNGISPQLFGDHFHNMVLSNRLLGEMQLKDAEAARTTFDRLQFERTDNPMAVMIGATALAFLIWQNDFETYRATEAVLTQWAAIDSASALEVMGGHAILLDPWKERWQTLTQQDDAACWDAVQRLPLVFRDAAMPRLEVQTRKALVPTWLPWATGLMGLVVVGSALWWVGIRRRMELRTNDELLSDLANTNHHRIARRHAFSLLVERIAEQSLAQINPSTADLNGFESEVFRDWTLGIRPKDTAKRTGRSVSTVYNARVSVRRKLNLPEGEDPSDLEVNLSNPTS